MRQNNKFELESVTDAAYQAFKTAVGTKDRKSAVWAQLLYSDNLAMLLSNAVHDDPFMYQDRSIYLERRGKARPIGWYILQYALGNGPSVILENSLSHKEKWGEDILLFPTNLSEEDLMLVINNQGIPYARVQDAAIELAHAGKFEVIVNALDYARSSRKST